MTRFLSVLLALCSMVFSYDQVVSQTIAKTKVKKPAVEVVADVIFTPPQNPPTPPGVPVPYPNVTASPENKKTIKRGEKFSFILSGTSLEKLVTPQVYINRRRSNKIRVKLEPLPRNRRNVRKRKLYVTFHDDWRTSSLKLNFRPDIKSRTIFYQKYAAPIQNE